MKKNEHTKLKLHAEMINLAFTSLKEVLPAVTSYNKIKTKNNPILLGEWQATKK